MRSSNTASEYESLFSYNQKRVNNATRWGMGLTISIFLLLIGGLSIGEYFLFGKIESLKGERDDQADKLRNNSQAHQLNITITLSNIHDLIESRLSPIIKAYNYNAMPLCPPPYYCNNPQTGPKPFGYYEEVCRGIWGSLKQYVNINGTGFCTGTKDLWPYGYQESDMAVHAVCTDLVTTYCQRVNEFAPYHVLIATLEDIKSKETGFGMIIALGGVAFIASSITVAKLLRLRSHMGLHLFDTGQKHARIAEVNEQDSENADENILPASSVNYGGVGA